MTLKSQDTRVYRGLVWVGRIYRFAGWMGLIATAFFTLWGFFTQWNSVSTYWYQPDLWTIVSQSLLAATAILITGLLLSAVAFGISLGIQVGLTLMKNSQIQVDLLRRMAQNQSHADSVLRLEDHGANGSALEPISEQRAQEKAH